MSAPSNPTGSMVSLESSVGFDEVAVARHRNPNTFAESIEPSQWWDQLYCRHGDDLHQKLCLAVLQTAIADLNGHRERLRLDAVEWFSLDSPELFSFWSVAEALGLDPTAIRAKLEGGEFRRLAV